MRAADVTKNVDTGRAEHRVLEWILLGHFQRSIMQQQWYIESTPLTYCLFMVQTHASKIINQVVPGSTQTTIGR